MSEMNEQTIPVERYTAEQWAALNAARERLEAERKRDEAEREQKRAAENEALRALEAARRQAEAEAERRQNDPRELAREIGALASNVNRIKARGGSMVADMAAIRQELDLVCRWIALASPRLFADTDAR
jgi:hypothetical protein